MSVKDLLVTIDASDAGEARLQLGIALAGRLGARLLGCYVSPSAGKRVGSDPASVPFEGATPVETTMAGRFAEEARLKGIDATWSPTGGDPLADVVGQMRVSDLAILGQIDPDRAVRDQGFRPEEAILDSGRPALVVPYIGAQQTLGDRVLVAWDGSHQASRALHDAMPFLVEAEAVSVMSVDREEHAGARTPSVEMAAAHLRRHGIKAMAENSLSLDLEIADILLSRAGDFGADLIVAGAYGHSRLREAMLGGVSRGLLERMTVPVLMSH